jgi:hypothetical protein
VSGYQGISKWLSGHQDVSFKDLLHFYSPDILVH